MKTLGLPDLGWDVGTWSANGWADSDTTSDFSSREPREPADILLPNRYVNNL